MIIQSIQLYESTVLENNCKVIHRLIDELNIHQLSKYLSLLSTFSVISNDAFNYCSISNKNKQFKNNEYFRAFQYKQSGIDDITFKYGDKIKIKQNIEYDIHLLSSSKQVFLQ